MVASYKEARMRLTLLAAASALTVMAGILPAAADGTFKPTLAVTIPGKPPNSFDISFVDPMIRLYFLSDRSNKSVDVIDTVTNTVQYQVGGFAGACQGRPAPSSADP